MQITRQRVRPALDITTSEECPTCHGKGSIQPSMLFTDRLEDKIAYMVLQLKKNDFKLHLHPYVAAYIDKGGLFSLKWQWKRKYSFRFKIIPDQSLALLEYRFFDKDRNEIDLQEEVEIKHK